MSELKEEFFKTFISTDCTEDDLKQALEGTLVVFPDCLITPQDLWRWIESKKEELSK